jgi:hypothetical protein
MCADLESVAVSNDPENPPLNSSNTSLFRRQSQIERAIQRAALVFPLQPCRSGIGGMFIAISAIP